MGYSRGMGVTAAVSTYSILSIGDGLISQIPSLIISISSGFLVTKISSNRGVGQDLSRQFLKTGQPLTTAAFIIGAMALVPGMPKIQFLLLAAGTALVGRIATKNERMPAQSAPISQKKSEKEPVEDLLDVDRVSVHVGVRLITMVDPRRSNTIFDRIGALRRQFAQQMGIVIPLVRLRDDLNLEPNVYEIRLSDIPVAKGRLEPDMFLAMDSGATQQKIDGIKTTEPVYGLPALWIQASKRETAELNGYTVIDPESVFITHLSETLRRHADELLTREDVQLLIDRLRKNQPSLVGEVVGTEGEVSAGVLQRVLRNLLHSGIPVRELTAILEALAENASKTKNVTTLTEIVRKSLSRTITELYRDAKGKIAAIMFDPSFEHQMTSSLRQENGELILGVPAETAIELNRKTADAWKSVMDQGKDKAILLCDARLRAPLAQMLARSLPMLPVVAYDEIVLGTEMQSVATISVAASEMSIRSV